jgi:biotin operon repressor
LDVADKLSKAGLSEKEALIYSFLLEHEGAFPSVIAQETGLNRTTTYKVLDALAIKGLVVESERRKKFFYRAEKPARLGRYADIQISLAQDAKANLDRLMPILDGLYRASPDKPVVRFFEGKDGITAVYDEHVAVKKPYEMLAFSNTAGLLPMLSQQYKEAYVQKKAKIGINTRAIVPDTPENTKVLSDFYEHFPKRLSTEFRYLSPDKFSFKGDLTLFGENMVSIINFNEPHFAGTIIEDGVIHNMMRMFFDLTWDSLPQSQQ